MAKEYKLIYHRKGKRYCNRCGLEVKQEKRIKCYSFYCPHCDENMYTFETHTEKER